MGWLTEKLKNRPRLMIPVLIMIVVLVGLGLVMLFSSGRRPAEERAPVISEQPPLSASFLLTLEVQESAGEVDQKPTAESSQEKLSVTPVSPLPKPAAPSTKKPEATEIKPTPEPATPLKVSLSDEEIFERLFPSEYRDILASLQNQFIEAGLMKPEEQEDFKSLASIVSFAEKEYALLLKLGTFTQAEYDKAMKALHGVFLDLVSQEEAFLRRSSRGQNLQNYTLKQFNESCKAQDGLLGKIWELAKNFFSRPALAQGLGFLEGILGALSPDCYRSGIPKPGGYNVFAPCCKCSVYTPTVPPIKVPIGCLNLICRSPNPAIFDQMTFICGCG